jgi:hypothetical protein
MWGTFEAMGGTSASRRFSVGARVPIGVLAALVACLFVVLQASEARAGSSAPRSPARAQYGVDLRICHKTEDGRFVVITIDESSLNAHLAHGDVYPVSSGCVRVSATAGAEQEDLLETVTKRELPFTGLPLWIFVAAGVPLLGLGFGLRRLGSAKA